METYVVLHNIRSRHNVGSIFRTADGAGVSKIFLTGYTPLPVDRFGRRVTEIEKTSLGATQSVPWKYQEDIFSLIDDLKREAVTVIAIEQAQTSVPYTETSKEEKRAFIFGNEIEGIPKEVCEKADAIVEIPMRGSKESLNVSVAAGIILFDVVR